MELRHALAGSGTSPWREWAGYVRLAGVYAFLTAGAALMLLPFAWMIITSLKPPSEVMGYPPIWWPSQFRWDNYLTAWTAAPFGRFFLNTVITAGGATLGTLVTSVLAGYTFSHMAFRGKEALFALLVASLAIPQEVTIIPSFLVIRVLDWIDSYPALIVPSLASVFGIFLMRQAFGAMPKELFDAARIDGSGHLQYVWRVLVPLNRPALATVGLFTFLGQWNAYLWPLLVTNSQEMRTVQVGLRYFMNEDLGNAWGALMAASTMVVAPTLVAFLLSQRQMIRGLAFTGIKG